MSSLQTSVILEDVPKILNQEWPDIFADALGTAVCYHDDGMYERCGLLTAYHLKTGHREGVYSAISAVTGRGWRIGFDEVACYPEKYGVQDVPPNFAISSLEAHLQYFDSLLEAVRLVDRVPKLLWNRECTYPVDPKQAAGFIKASQTVDCQEVRRYVTEALAERGKPVILLLHLPQAQIVEMALIAGYEEGGEVILGRSPYQNEKMDNSGEFGYFRMRDWEQETIAIVGFGEERKSEEVVFSTAIHNALRFSVSESCGTKHYGLSAYDAWERFLLDEGGIAGANDEILARKLQYHSAFAGFIACQKAFTVMPEGHVAPSMGVVSGLAGRAGATPIMIHGLMWDAWHVVGGYWRMKKPGWEGWLGTEDLERFKDPAVREKAANVVRRARRMDAQAIQDLQEAVHEWEHCLGQGKPHPCPCMDRQCARVSLY